MTAYDELPYTDHAYAEAHPDRFAVVARLSGWAAPEVATARVLEIGCGRGGNLLPMAAALPGARLVGVDASERRIAEARAIAAEAGLANVQLVHARFEDFGAGEFDYVVCHGLYSWISVSARRALLERIAGALAPCGVAHVSFNVLPGWYARMAARDWLRFDRAADPRASLAWLVRQIPKDNASYRQGLERVLARLEQTERAYAVHEFMAAEHHPMSVSDFFDEIEAAGLVYLGDAIPAQTALEHLPEEAAARARALDARGAQQCVDFVTAATFRRALLVRASEARARAWSWPARLDHRAIRAMRVASRLVPRGAGRFDAGAETLQIADPALERALTRLAEATPHALAVSEVGGLASEEVLDLWLATGAIDLVTHEPPIGEAGERPRACPVARWHAARAGPITNRRHHEVVLAEPIVRSVLARLDGTRTVDDLARETNAAAPLVRASVDLLARAALLEA